MPIERAKPSELELQVLSVIWSRGPSTVREILEAIPDGKRRAYTTILSVTQDMEKKGLVAHERCGLAYVYRAAVTRKQVLKPLLSSLVANVFGGSQAAALQFLLSETNVSKDELEAMRRLIREAGSSEKPSRK